jgi:osmotically-inducible protein OsmY
LGAYDEQGKTAHEYAKEIEMSRPKTIYALPLAFILIGVLQGCADLRSSGSETRSADAQITADVQSRLDKAADLGPPGSIRVQTRDQVVYLNGLVDVGLEKGVAESAAFQSPGVKQVVDSIAVPHS